MHALDWLVVVAYLVWIVYDGLKRSKGTDKVEGYFLANRSLPWWAVGLSFIQRSEEHTSELQSQSNLVCRLLLEKKKKKTKRQSTCTMHQVYSNTRYIV